MAKKKYKDPLKEPIVVPQELIAAMSRTWQNIACDIEVKNNIEAIEVILDADYMVMYGGEKGKEMSALVDKLCEEYELMDVYRSIGAVARFA